MQEVIDLTIIEGERQGRTFIGGMALPSSDHFVEGPAAEMILEEAQGELQFFGRNGESLERVLAYQVLW